MAPPDDATARHVARWRALGFRVRLRLVDEVGSLVQAYVQVLGSRAQTRVGLRPVTSASACVEYVEDACRPAPSRTPAAARGGGRFARRRGSARRAGTSPGRARCAPRRRAPSSSDRAPARRRSSGRGRGRRRSAGASSCSVAQPVDQVARRRWRRSRRAIALQQRDRGDAPRRTTTGLPPNVLACAPGGHVMTSARAQVTPSGRPDAIPLAMLTMSAFTPKCSRREHLPRPPHARLHFVDAPA